MRHRVSEHRSLKVIDGRRWCPIRRPQSLVECLVWSARWRSAQRERLVPPVHRARPEATVRAGQSRLLQAVSAAVLR